MKIFVSATEFCRRNNLHVFNLICFCATRCGDKDFRTNSPVHTKRFAAAKCCCNLLPSARERDPRVSLARRSPLFKSAPVSRHFCYHLLGSLDVILAVQEALATVTTVLSSAGSNLVIALSCGLAKKSRATFSTNEK